MGAGWQSSPVVIDLRLLDEYERLFPYTPIVLASNATTKLDKDISRTGLPERLNRIFNSSDIGFAKPDLAFFDYILKELCCAPDEVIFIDDQKENVLAAENIGIRSFHFSDLSTLVAQLSRFRSRIL